MTKEDYVKALIKSAGHTMKSFAQSIDLPYTTLLGMLTRGLDGASVHNVIRVCQALDITVEDLERVESDGIAPIPFYINEHEKLVIVQYRNLPAMRPAVDAILGIDKVTEDED